MNIRNKMIDIAAALKMASVLAVMPALTGCIYDSIDGCPTHRFVKIRYDMNLKFADAAPAEVRTVDLYAADSTGLIVYGKTVNEERLAADDYVIDVSDIPSGRYTVVAWAKGIERNSGSYVREAIVPGRSSLDDLAVSIARGEDNVISKDLTPLFNGIASNVDLTDCRTGGSRTVDLDMTKNTNVVRVMLQHISGEPVDYKDFVFEISDANGTMAWDNAIVRSDSLTYRPWALSSGSADLEKSKAQTSVGVAMAEFTTGRLMTGSRPVLTVRNAAGECVLSIPVVDYALLIKGHYNEAMSGQEYLDRQDEYNMTFFLDKNDKWVSSSIIINSWRVVLSDVNI